MEDVTLFALFPQATTKMALVRNGHFFEEIAMDKADIPFLSVAELARLIERKDVSPVNVS